MLTLLVPILINYLLEAHQLKTSSKFRTQLHDQSLKWLMKIGPKYPQEFKSLMSQLPELRATLETAIRNNQVISDQRNKMEYESNSSGSNKSNLNHVKPTIQLKTDFSNFS